MNLESFLPAYPSMEEKESYPNFDTSFNQAIFNKKEFYDYKLEKSPPRSHSRGKLLRHQVLVRRFLSPYTMYNELFLYHAPGSGKTMSAIGVCEHFFNAGISTMNKAIVIVNNEELIQRFIRELYTSIEEYTPSQENMQFIDPNQREGVLFQRAKALVSERYVFYTYRTFYTNVLKKLTDEALVRDYSNRIIIFDEVHHILQEDSDTYTKYHHFFHTIENRKLLLMTGTPMRNEAVEFGRLLNLMLPLDEQLPIDTFDAFIETDDGLLMLQDAIRGRVSYIRTRTDVQKVFVGERITPITSINLYPSIMSSFQYTQYQGISEDESSSWLIESRKASQMVFDGELTYENFMSRFKGLRTQDERLARIEQYSTKYAKAIQEIINNKNQNCFVYTEFIQGIGAVAFGWCLELFGYRNTKKSVGNRGRRYSLLASSQGTKIDDVVKSFNQKRNRDGSLIQVLIGGKQVGEGYTFRNIQQIHILSPQWNFSTIDQAIARGVRFKSHRNLPEDTVVRIFLHVSLYPNVPWEDFADLILYNTAMEKDMKIKAIEYLAKVTSFDCALAYQRNVQQFEEDGSRECDYQVCRYRCDGVAFPYILTNEQLDTTTYDLYYGDVNFTSFLQDVRDILANRYSLPLLELWEKVRSKYTVYQFFFLVTQLIRQPIPIESPLGFTSYLRQDKDQLFLVSSVLDSNLTDSFYVANPPTQLQSSFRYSVKHVINNNLKQMEAISLQEKKTVIPLLPISIQERFLEQSILLTEEEEKSALADWMYTSYTDVFQEQESTIESTLVNPPRVFDRETKQWSNKTSTATIAHPKPLYGTYNNQQQFKVVDIRNVPLEKQTTFTGQVCSTLGRPKLKKLALELDIAIDRKMKVKTICELIEEKFNQLGIIF